MFNRLSDWVDYVAALIEQGAYVRRDSDRGPGLLIPGPAVQDAERPEPPEPGPDPVHGTSRYIGRDILDWPEHWQRANGLRAEDLELRGATHTVADLLALTPDVPLCATIGARVMSLAASGAWTRVRVDDGSAQLDVSCPYQTTLLGPLSAAGTSSTSWYRPARSGRHPTRRRRPPASRTPSSSSPPSTSPGTEERPAP